MEDLRKIECLVDLIVGGVDKMKMGVMKYELKKRNS
jgi:hypothetical protein